MKWDRRFLEMSYLIGTWSKDPSTQCGAVIVGPDHSVISIGFNGFPKGMKDDLELYVDREVKLSRMIHAEMNAVLHTKDLPKGCTLYTTPILPCDRCVVHMLQAGIRRFVSYKISDSGARERWARSLELTQQYIAELSGEVILI